MQQVKTPHANLLCMGPLGGMPLPPGQHPLVQPHWEPLQQPPQQPPRQPLQQPTQWMQPVQSMQQSMQQPMQPAWSAEQVQAMQPAQPTQLKQPTSPLSRSKEQVTDLLLKVLAGMPPAAPKRQDKVTGLLMQLIDNNNTQTVGAARLFKAGTHQEPPPAQRSAPAMKQDQGIGCTSPWPGAGAHVPAAVSQQHDLGYKAFLSPSEDLVSTTAGVCTAGTLETVDDDGDADAAMAGDASDEERGMHSPGLPGQLEKKVYDAPVTTLMVRNMPVMCTQDTLLEEWPIDGTWDFMYLPHSCGGQVNLSYAFINFITPAHAQAFKARWQKRKLAHFDDTKKLLNVSFADVQGLEANLMQIKKKRVGRIRRRQGQPIIIQDGQQIPLEDALAAIEGHSTTCSDEATATLVPTVTPPPGL